MMAVVLSLRCPVRFQLQIDVKVHGSAKQVIVTLTLAHFGHMKSSTTAKSG